MLSNICRPFCSVQSLWIRSAVSAWILVLAIVCVRSAVQSEKNNVFHIFHLAGQNWQQGKDLYGKVAPDRDVFRYSPLIAAGFSPISQVPLSLGNVLWRVLNMAVFLGALMIWAREILPQPLNRIQMAQLSLLGLPLTVPSLNNGQINPLMVSVILLAPVLAKRGRFVLCGFCLAAAFWMKLYPLSLGLLLLLVYPVRLSPWLIVVLVLGLILPFALQTPPYVNSQYQKWIVYLQTDNREMVPLDYWPRDIRLLFRVWWVPLPEKVYPALQILVAGVMAGLVLWARYRQLDQKELLTFLTGLACLWMTIFGPATESPTFIVLAPSLAAFLLLVWSRPVSPWLRGLVLISYGLFVAAHVGKWFPWGNALANLGPQPVGGLIFLGCFVFYEIWKARYQQKVEDRVAETNPPLAA